MKLTKRRHVSPHPPRMPPSLKYRSGVSKVKNNNKTKSTRLAATVAAAAAASSAMTQMKPQGMRQWLEKLLDEASCKGLAWQDREQRQFRITWCHASRHDFDTEEHADVFFQYAKFTGRANTIGGSGSKNGGYNSKLKSNFRSALHSLIDCINVKDTASGGRGKEENAIKVYQFIAANHPEYKRKKAEKRKSQHRNKKRKASTKCKPQDDVVEQVEQETAVDAISSHRHQAIISECPEEIILPDEAKDYLFSSNLDLESKFAIPDLVNSAILTSSVTLSQASVSSLPVLPNFVASPDPTPWSSHPLLEASAIFETTLLPLVSNVPDFKALGMDNNYTPPVERINESLHSGGSMLVKKEEPIAAVEEFIIPHLDTAADASSSSYSYRENRSSCLENVSDPFMNPADTGESLHQLQPVELGQGFPQVKERVVVLFENPQSVLQTDGYQIGWNPDWKPL